MATASAKADKDSNVTAISEARTRPKQLIVILLTGLLLCAASAAAAAWWLMHSSTPAAAKPQPPAPPLFLELETFTVNLAGDRILQTTISLQLKKSEDIDQLKLYLPQVKSRLLLLLSAKTAEALQTPEGKQALSADIASALGKPYAQPLAPPAIIGVFLTSFVIQ